MGTFFFTIAVIVGGLAAFVAVLLALYALTGLLPDRMRDRARAFVFAGPALFLVFAGLLVPMVKTIYTSLFDDNGKKYVGVANFREIFSASDTRLTVFNSLTWVVVGTAAVVIVGLSIARFSDGMRNEKTAKSLIFIPQAISLAGAGIIWRFVYAGPPFKVGLLNQITKGLHLRSSLGGDGDHIWMLERAYGLLKPPSQSAPGFNTLLLIVVFIWASAGFATVILSAAIKGVPGELLEAARVDGATSNQVFFRVTIPYIKGTLATVATITMLGGLKAFDIVATSTGGNFGTSTIANDFYRTFFVQDREGFGSALAVVLLLLCFPVVLLNRRIQQRVSETQ